VHEANNREGREDHKDRETHEANDREGRKNTRAMIARAATAVAARPKNAYLNVLLYMETRMRNKIIY
jgi:hypothetical protein